MILTEWLLVVEFQYNDKKHLTIGYMLFKLNFGQHSQKRDLTIKIELPKLETFLKKLQKSWKVAKTLMEIAKTIKKQFDKKRQNLQGLKQEDNMWLETKNIQLKQPSKKLDQKEYRAFEIIKDIS